MQRIIRRPDPESCHAAMKNGNRRSLHYATPDFLLSLVALANFMRLSLLKAAHAVVSSAV
jgi:hypothetical protein